MRLGGQAPELCADMGRQGSEHRKEREEKRKRIYTCCNSTPERQEITLSLRPRRLHIRTISKDKGKCVKKTNKQTKNSEPKE